MGPALVHYYYSAAVYRHHTDRMHVGKQRANPNCGMPQAALVQCGGLRSIYLLHSRYTVRNFAVQRAPISDLLVGSGAGIGLLP